MYNVYDEIWCQWQMLCRLLNPCFRPVTTTICQMFLWVPEGAHSPLWSASVILAFWIWPWTKEATKLLDNITPLKWNVVTKFVCFSHGNYVSYKLVENIIWVQIVFFFFFKTIFSLINFACNTKIKSYLTRKIIYYPFSSVKL